MKRGITLALAVSVLMISAQIMITSNAYGYTYGPHYFSDNKTGYENMLEMQHQTNAIRETTWNNAGLNAATEWEYANIGYTSKSVDNFEVSIKVYMDIVYTYRGDTDLGQVAGTDSDIYYSSYTPYTALINNAAYVKVENISKTENGRKGEWEEINFKTWVQNITIWQVTKDFTYTAENNLRKPLLINAGSYIIIFEAEYNGARYTSYGVFTTPVPAAAWLFVTGLTGIAALRRRQK